MGYRFRVAGELVQKYKYGICYGVEQMQVSLIGEMINMTKNLIDFQTHKSSEGFTDVISMIKSFGFNAHHYHKNETGRYGADKSPKKLMTSKNQKRRLA